MSQSGKVKVQNWTEIIEVVSVPSASNGGLSVVFRIMESDDGQKYVDIARMRGDYRISGVTVRLEDISIIREAFDAIDDAIKESVSV